MQLPWTVGDTVNMSIGQGFASYTTPTRDYVCRASQRWLPSSASLIKDNEAAKTWRKSLNLKPETIRVLRQGLRQVVVIGTGRGCECANDSSASGKSGTAEVFGGKSHAWFGAYAPIISQRSSLWRLLNMPVVAAASCCSMVLKVMAAYFHR